MARPNSIINVSQKIGDRIWGFGYPGSAAIASSRAPFLEIDWGLNPSTTVGEVTDIYEERRDRAVLSFPCFQVNARFDGGMSGGPIFNDDGQICGVICASMSIPGENSFVSYVATLWPSMPTTIDYEGPGFEVSGGYGVFELFKIGFLKEIGWSEVYGRIRIETDDNGSDYLRLQ